MQHFRKDIEGLRAIAVILVILFHYEISIFTGGFVGVDVFFVISGFVITELLNRNIQKQQFSFSNFYRRRILRLVPAFLVVSLVSFLLITPYYMDEEYYIFSKSWMASLVGLSNIYYFQELSQYFSADTHIITLLHTWSLAVEEQFYFLWPAIMYGLYRYGVKITDHFIVFIFVWFLFFGLSIYLAETNPKAAYYLLPARVFELMLGVGISLYKLRLPTLNRATAELIALTGSALILATAVLITYLDHFPGYNALWPTLGTALIIYSGGQHNTLVSRFLQHKTLVFCGGISYAVYLWHWPPIAFINYQLIEVSLLEKVLLIAAVFLLSWLTHVFIENRFRYKDWNFKRAFLFLIFIPAVLIWLVQVTIRTNDDISFRIPEHKRDLYRIINQSNANDIYKSCFKGDYYRFERGPKCIMGDSKDPAKINSVLIGDSHANALTGFVDTLIKNQGYTTLIITQASTPFITHEDAKVFYAKDEEKYLRSKAITEYLTNSGPTTVFVGAHWDAYLAGDGFQEYLYNSLKWLVEKNHIIYVVEDAPALPSASFAYCLIKTGKDCDIDATEVERVAANFERFKEKIQKDYPDIIWLKPKKVICDSAICKTTLDGIPLYRDESHLNLIGAQKIAERYLELFDNPIKPYVQN